MRCNSTASFEYTPSNPVETSVHSCGFSAYHLPKNRAYVLNLATAHYPRPLAR